MRFLRLCACALFLAACYDYTPADGEKACGAAGECPPGQTCWTSDHRCHGGGADGGAHRADASDLPDADTAPEATILLPEAGTTTGTTVQVTFTAAGLGSLFECSLDDAAFAPCVSPHTYAGLAGGAHTVRVRAVSAGGAVGPEAARGFDVDAVGPTVKIAGTPASGEITNATSADLALTSIPPGATFECQIDGAAFVVCPAALHLDALAEGGHTVKVHGRLHGVTGGVTSIVWTVDVTAPTVSFDVAPPDPSNARRPSFRFTATDGAIDCALDGAAFAACATPWSAAADLADGAHALVVRATDLAGNQGQAVAHWTVDTVAPSLTLAGAPQSPTRDPQASFAFGASEGVLTCQVDSGAFAPCVSPVTLTVAEGAHSFSVRAVDAAGNAAVRSASWTVDTTPPTLSIDTPPRDPGNATSVSVPFTLSEGTATCALDGAAAKACATPFTASGLADGRHTLVIVATDAAGNASAPATASFTVDTVPPTLSLTSVPPDLGNSAQVSLSFTSDGTTTCQLDAGAAAACASPASFTAAGDGDHAVTVVARDAAGNTTQKRAVFTVDTTAPVVTVAAPPDPTAQKTASLSFSASDGALACELDHAGLAPCASPKSVGPLADGAHTFTVQARDAAGNLGSASATWHVDATPPVVAIDGSRAPASVTSSASAAFAFTVSDASATAATCRLDATPAAACSGLVSYPGLADGTHSFLVTVTDAAGNQGTATWSWRIDRQVPLVTFLGHPADPTNQTTATFTFTADKGTLTCSLDGATFAACGSPVTASGLAAGPHAFRVRATDSAGNVGTAELDWAIDTQAPVAAIDRGKPMPADPSNATTWSFYFATNEGTLACQVDGGSWQTPCASPRSVGPLGEGAHVFSVRAADAAGNSSAVDSFGWTIDVTAPIVSITGQPPLLGKNAAVQVAFDAGGGAPTCELDGQGERTCASPWTGTLADGSHTLVVRARDAAGNVGSAGTSFTIDTQAPVVAVDRGSPAARSNVKSPSLSFTVSDGTVACALDGAALTGCASPRTVGPLADGAHTFTVSATDAAGNLGSDSYTWTVDTVPPMIAFTGKPPANAASASATFDFTVTAPAGDHVAATACQLDGNAVACATLPLTLSGLADGSHTFQVSATDTAGNLAQLAHSWNVDTQKPVVTITSGPVLVNGFSVAHGVQFYFTASEGTTTCTVDGGAPQGCVSGVSFTVADGGHGFAVTATDLAGNSGTASFAWQVDGAAPTIVVTGKPAAQTNAPSGTITFTVTDGNLSSVTCQLDGAATGACTSPYAFSALADGGHVVRIVAGDLAGNTTPVNVSWLQDTVAPDVAITGKPANPSNVAAPALTFGSSDPTADLTCALDGGSFVPCTSPRTLGGLSDGSRTFSVKATDKAGNSSGASYTWIVDLTAPTTTIGSPPANPTNKTSASFTLSASEPSATFACSLDGAAFGACPATYAALAAGGHTFSARATDAAGNSGAAASYGWTIDLLSPVVTFTGGPNGLTNDRSPVISFTVSDGSACTTVCSLNGNQASCSSPVTLSNLADGSYTYTVNASDAAGNPATVKSLSFTVDATPPALTLGAAPPSQSNSRSASLAFTAGSDAVSVKCKLDGAAFTACTSPYVVSSLGETAHTITVQAADAAGNLTTKSVSWTVDVTPPNVYFTGDGTPPAYSASSSATLKFGGEAGAALTCSLDFVPSQPCASPLVLTSLGEGTHYFYVTATDAAGNFDYTSVSWTVDTTPPVITWTALPPAYSSSASVAISYSVSDANPMPTSCLIDGAYACGNYNLGEGSHRVDVTATDKAGNSTSASYTWVIDTTAPTVVITNAIWGSRGVGTHRTSTVSFQFSVTDNQPGWTLSCSFIANGIADTTPCDPSGTKSITYDYGYGDHVFTVIATDKAGNAGFADYYFSLDPPDPP